MNTKIISGVLASALLLSMSPVNVMADTTSTTEPTGPSTEQTTQLKDTVIDIKDATMKATFGESTKTFTYTATMGITPTVSSSDTSVATVQEKNGVVTVTILKAGTSRITVAFEGNEEYKAASDYIDLTVEKAEPKLNISTSVEDVVGGGSVTLKVSGIPEGVTANVECNDSNVIITKVDATTYTANLGDVTKAYKFILSTEANDNYAANNTFCTVYVTSLEDSFVEEVIIGETEIKAAVVSDTVIMDTLTVKALEEIIDEDDEIEKLSFDFTNAFDEVEVVRLDRTTIRAIDSVLNDKYYDFETVEFILDSGKIEFDMDAWEAVVANCTTSGTTFSLTTHKLKELNNRQQKALRDYDVFTTVDFSIVGKKALTEIDGGITVSIDYNKNKSYGIVSLTTRGEVEEYKSTMDGNYIVFDTDACLDYAVVEKSGMTNPSPNTPPTSSNTEMIQGYEKNKVMVMTINNKVMSLYGTNYVNDVAPIIKNSRTMLPIRIVAENLGAHVGWNNALRKVTIEKSGIYIEIFIDSAYAKVNGKTVILDSPAFIQNDRTYLPIRFIAENLGATVLWDDYSRDVVIVPN